MAAVNLLPFVKSQFFDDNGDPLAGGRLYTYQAGTDTEKVTYSDAGGLTPHTNPVVLDSAGRATVFLGSGAYKLVLTDANDVTVWTEPSVVAGALAFEVGTVSDLKNLAPGSVSFIRTLGRLFTNDGGGWEYYWDAESTAADDGGMVLQPISLPVEGRYIGLVPSDRVLNLRVYGAVLDGVTDDTSAVQRCDTYCSANRCVVLVDGNLHITTDPGITVPVKLIRGAVISWGDFAPILSLDIDINDTTQHFTCPLAYVPTLVSAYMRPEWFGETYENHPKMTACLNRSQTTQKIMFTGMISTINAEMI